MRISPRLISRSFSSLGFIVFNILAIAAGVAAQANSHPLDSKWEFRAISKTDRADLQDWHPAQVPGVVQTDLLKDGLIPDPFYRDNDTRLQWIGLTDWEYRTTFQADATTMVHEHVDLVFEGLDTYADVYLNDQSVLHADNMFRRWRIPAKSLLKTGPNTLRIVFHSPIESMIPKVKALPYILPSVTTNNTGNEENVATAPYTRKAAYQYGWDWGPRYVTEGIWQPIRVEAWDALRIENFHIQQQLISKEVASLSAEFTIEASRSNAAGLEITYAQPTGAAFPVIRQSAQLVPGMNRISVPIHISNPKLWYPTGYGAQDRYQFSVVVRTGRDVAANVSLKTGLRAIELRREATKTGKSFAFVLNGIPVFAKGADVIPFDSFPNRVTPEIHRQILEAARDAHMNMVREWGGGYYESDDFYDICDELGILVWQEFMFGGDMVPGGAEFQNSVKQEAIDQVTRLRDHPSIVLWCGNNEIETGWAHWGDRQIFKASVSPDDREKVWTDYVVLFHGILSGVVDQYGGVPYWGSSPSANFENPPDSQTDGDMHYWQVWHALAPIEMYTQQFPRFMSEYGFQSFPEMRTIRTFAKPEDMDIRSPTMQDHQKNHGGNERILSYMLRWYPEPKDFPSFVYLSQVLQAEAIKVGAEHLRRQRPNTMGSLYWQLNDCWPVASWASIDYYGRWKALQYYTRRFYDDVIVSPFAHDGKVDVYVVSDKLQSLTGTIHTRLLDFSGKILTEKTQDVQVPAQSSAVYFTLDEKELLANGTDPKKSFLVFDLAVGRQPVSRNLAFFDTMHNLDLPKAPQINSSIDNSNGSYVVTLRSPVLARSVYVSFGDLDVQTSDNYFDLLPGEAVSIKLTTPPTSTLGQLKSTMQVQSLTDAFPASETMH